MRLLKTLFVGGLCLVFLLIGILFTIHNTQTVMIDLVFVQLPEASLSLWLMAFLALGAVVGVLLSIITILILRTRLGVANRKMNNTRKELDELRVTALKDAV